MGDLLGSTTRGNVVEALSMSTRPLTCYRISKLYNMNVAKVYAAMKKLAALGLVTPSRGRGGIEYLLQNEDLRRLALQLSSRVVTYEAWSSQDAKKERFRLGLSHIPALVLGGPSKLMSIKPSRVPGELDSLALLARAKFDGKYRMASDHAYDSV
jgi:hypothetical protein